MDILGTKVQKVLRDLRERDYLRREVESRYRFKSIVGTSPAMRAVFSLVEKVAPTNATVLIQGESGTGKELVARAVHHLSPRVEKPFIAVNSAAIPETLLESELFGHVKGAFTGAVADKEGKFELAHEGTIFLDEVGDMSSPLQAKILRVLQERSFERIGGKQTIEVDVRVIAATNKDLAREMRAGKFRSDLYYRLNVVLIQLPPLTQRREDIPLLIDWFIEWHSANIKRRIKGIDQAALNVLLGYDFPGNVRESSSIIERAIIIEDSESEKITLNSLPAELIYWSREMNPDAPLDALPHQKAKEAFEKKYLLWLLKKTGGNISQAARLANMDRNNFKDKLKKYGIQVPHDKG